MVKLITNNVMYTIWLSYISGRSKYDQIVSNNKLYYIAPFGDDNNPGTIDRPWKTTENTFNSRDINPGDIVYFRGGWSLS